MLDFRDNFPTEVWLLCTEKVSALNLSDSLVEWPVHLSVNQRFTLYKSIKFLMKNVLALAFVAALTLSTAVFAQDKMKDDKMKKDKMSTSKMDDTKMAKDKMSDDKMMNDKMGGKKMSKHKMKKDKMKMSDEKMKSGN